MQRALFSEWIERGSRTAGPHAGDQFDNVQTLSPLSKEQPSGMPWLGLHHGKLLLSQLIYLSRGLFA